MWELREQIGLVDLQGSTAARRLAMSFFGVITNMQRVLSSESALGGILAIDNFPQFLMLDKLSPVRGR